MKLRSLKPSATVLVAAVALVIGLEAPAMAHQVKVAAHRVSGSTIKKHSIAGNRLKHNTLTGTQIKESTLGTVPRATTATKLPPLKWHPITHFLNGWKRDTGDTGTLSVAYAVDAQGVVHLRGTITGGTAGTDAFALPAAVAPKKLLLNLPATMGDQPTAGVVEVRAGFLQPLENESLGAAEFDTFLDGVSFTTH